MNLGEELYSKWHETINRAKHIFTWTGDHEAAYLCERASRSHLAAEIGVYMGFSSYIMLAANPHLRLYACDPFEVAGTYEVARYMLREFEERVVLIRKPTEEAAKDVERYLNGRKVDLVFSDDGHAFENVRTDIRSFWPLLRRDGIFCGHDYDFKSDVYMAVQSLFPAEDVKEPVSRMWEYQKVTNELPKHEDHSRISNPI